MTIYLKKPKFEGIFNSSCLTPKVEHSSSLKIGSARPAMTQRSTCYPSLRYTQTIKRLYRPAFEDAMIMLPV